MSQSRMLYFIKSIIRSPVVLFSSKLTLMFADVADNTGYNSQIHAIKATPVNDDAVISVLCILCI